MNLAWLAGFIDGEACVTFHSRKDRRHLVARVTIHNTRLDVLQKIAEAFPCKLRVMKRNIRWKPVGQLDYRYHAAVELLKAVRPYLVAKTELADIILAYADRRTFEGRGHLKVPDEEVKVRTEMYNNVRLLNRRGG